MSPLSFCPEASPHSVCKVRVPSLPQFDSVKAWKQIKGCCFSQSWRDTEPVRTRPTRGSFATCCFCLWWGLKNVGTSLHSWFCSVFFSLSLQWVSYEDQDQEEHETFFSPSPPLKMFVFVLFFFLFCFWSHVLLFWAKASYSENWFGSNNQCIKKRPLSRPFNVNGSIYIFLSYSQMCSCR